MAISDSVLKSIKAGGDLLVEIEKLKYLPYQLVWGSEVQGYRRDSVQTVVGRLVRQGLIKKKIEDEKTYLALTELGEQFLERKERSIRLRLEQSSRNWDGLYRFVLFDIPERNRAVRDSLRQALKNIGAICWQKSVWVTKENITRELNAFFDANGLTDFCSVLEVKEIYNPKLKKLLG